MRRVVYRAGARDDLDRIYWHYELIRPTLGQDFLGSYRKVLELIRWNPWVFGEEWKTVRAVPLTRFPHVIYYRILESGTVLVIAVRHGRENPRTWKRRY